MTSSERTAALDTIPNVASWPTLAEAASRLGVTWKKVHGWIKRGVKAGADRARLPALKVGGTWRVDPAGVEVFFRRVTAASLGQDPDAPPPPPSARVARRRVAESMARLRAAGVGAEAGTPPTPRRKRR